MEEILLLIQNQTQWDAQKLQAFCSRNLIHCKIEGELALLNYMNDIPEEEWNIMNSACRGMVLNLASKKIIAYPFGKFTSYNTDDEAVGFISENKDKLSITKKYDGTMVLAFLYEGELKCASRNSFDNSQVQNAKRILDTRISLPEAMENITLVFEYISPENKIEVEYDKEELILIGARDIETGLLFTREQLEAFAQKTGLQVSEEIRLSIEELVQLAKDDNAGTFEEGWIIRAKSRMVKLKSWRYLAKLKSNRYGLNKKQIIDKYIRLNETDFKAYLDLITRKDILLSIDKILKDVDAKIQEVQEGISSEFKKINPELDDKAFALKIMKEYNKEQTSYLFALKKGKAVEPLIKSNIIPYLDFYNNDSVIPMDQLKEWAFDYLD